MQDFNYLSSNDFEITLELGCDKYPPASKLASEWERNRLPLYEFMWRVSTSRNHYYNGDEKINNKNINDIPIYSQTHQGIKGFVVDPNNKPIANAEISVFNISDNGEPVQLKHDVTSTKTGEFWRILLPGKPNSSLNKKMHG